MERKCEQIADFTWKYNEQFSIITMANNDVIVILAYVKYILWLAIKILFWKMVWVTESEYYKFQFGWNFERDYPLYVMLSLNY